MPVSRRVSKILAVPKFRSVRSARSARIVLAAALSAAALLPAGCRPGVEAEAGTGAEAGAEKPAGPMYRCLGEPGYAASWEEILADIAKDPPICGVPDSAAGRRPGLPGQADPPASVDSASLHVYMLDSRCRFLREFRDTVPAPGGSASVHAIRDLMQDAAGNPLGTGEYFVNVAIEYADGSRDTAYQKFGFIRRSCPPPATEP